MAHKVHPKIFRVRETKDWNSRWFEKKNYAALLQEDFLIREYIGKKLKDAALESVEIERFSGKLNVTIKSARPGLIIGRGGAGIEELRAGIEKDLMRKLNLKKDELQQLKLDVQEIKNPWESASLSAQWVAQQLERRMPHRRTLKHGLSKIMANKGIEGARIEVSGRLGGADIARKERVKEGRLPLQTLRANIDYALKEAKTTYGIIGVKVWIYKGETLE